MSVFSEKQINFYFFYVVFTAKTAEKDVNVTTTFIPTGSARSVRRCTNLLYRLSSNWILRLFPQYDDKSLVTVLYNIHKLLSDPMLA